MNIFSILKWFHLFHPWYLVSLLVLFYESGGWGVVVNSNKVQVKHQKMVA